LDLLNKYKSCHRIKEGGVCGACGLYGGEE